MSFSPGSFDRFSNGQEWLLDLGLIRRCDPAATTTPGHHDPFLDAIPRRELQFCRRGIPFIWRECCPNRLSLFRSVYAASGLDCGMLRLASPEPINGEKENQERTSEG